MGVGERDRMWMTGVLGHSVLKVATRGLILEVRGWERRGLYGGIGDARLRRRRDLGLRGGKTKS